MKAIFLLIGFCFWATSMMGQGRILWNESLHGQISENYATPTQLGNLSVGTNSIIATISTEPVGNGWFTHNDYFNFAVGPGYQVERLFVTIDSPGILTWIGSPGFGLPVVGYNPSPTSGDLLAQIGTWSISSGSYGMYLENYNFQPAPAFANYRLDFVVSPIPEPGIWSLLALGGATLWGARRWRRQ